MLRIYAAIVGLVLVTVTVVLATRQHSEVVLNPSAEANLSDWRGASDDGPLPLERVKVADGPQGSETAVDVRHGPASRQWCFVLAGLRDPAGAFQTGHTYRMRAYVRDVAASGRSIGILLANGNFAHRPTESYAYRQYSDDSWHLLQRTFVASSTAGADTALYFDLPTQGPLHWQITRASVQEVQSIEPSVLWDQAPTMELRFDGRAGSPPDRGSWRHEVGGNGWGNDEVQSNTTSPANAHLDGHGSLVLTAIQEPTTGPDGITRPYSSARLATTDAVKIRPGSYVEATLRAPAETGVRPAFWLLGANLRDVGWPACGELDVMEASGRSPSLVRQTIHVPSTTDRTRDAPYGDEVPTGTTRLDTPRDDQPHRYGVYFDKDVVQFYVDRRPRLRLTREEAQERDRAWPFDQPQRALLNLALGSEAAGARFPISMTVANVSVWVGGVPPA